MNDVYCGPAPTTGSLMGAWNLDLTALLLCGAIVVAHAAFGNARRRAPTYAAVALLAFLFLSPLCALTAALFSARAAHHVLLVAGAAPLLALAFPAALHSRTIAIGWIAALHAGTFWLWHAPPVYAVAIADPLVYWSMQSSLLGTGFWLWRRVLDGREDAGRVILALLGTTIQMGMLGALLTFAPSPLYEAHLLTTIPFGLAPVHDQQLAGLIMWVPAALPYLAAALYRAWPLLGRSGRGAPWSG